MTPTVRPSPGVGICHWASVSWLAKAASARAPASRRPASSSARLLTRDGVSMDVVVLFMRMNLAGAGLALLPRIGPFVAEMLAWPIRASGASLQQSEAGGVPDRGRPGGHIELGQRVRDVTMHGVF